MKLSEAEFRMLLYFLEAPDPTQDKVPAGERLHLHDITAVLQTRLAKRLMTEPLYMRDEELRQAIKLVVRRPLPTCPLRYRNTNNELVLRQSLLDKLHRQLAEQTSQN